MSYQHSGVVVGHMALFFLSSSSSSFFFFFFSLNIYF
jgi:hypothetical protein